MSNHILDVHRRVLCVDDDVHALGTVQRVLRSRFDVTTTPSSDHAARLVEEQAFGVIVTDLRMPGMDGVQLLAHTRVVSPHTERILISGQADLEAALRAINEGQLFRFLLKPCSASDLVAAVTNASDINRAVTAERILLEQTLTASVTALVDLLAITQPEFFGRAARLRRYAEAVANELGLEPHWALGVAAQLTQVGYIIVPEATVAKVRRNDPLTDEEKVLIGRLLPFAVRLVSAIPRLDPVCTILRLQYERPQDVDADDQAVHSAQILRVVMAYDTLESSGLSPVAALNRLERVRGFDRTTLTALRRLTESPMRRHHAAPIAVEVGPARKPRRPRSVTPPEASEPVAVEESQDTALTMMLADVRKGMQFADDVVNANGVLLVARGQEVTDSLVERILHSWSDFARSLPVRIVPEE